MELPTSKMTVTNVPRREKGGETATATATATTAPSQRSSFHSYLSGSSGDEDDSSCKSDAFSLPSFDAFDDQYGNDEQERAAVIQGAKDRKNQKKKKDDDWTIATADSTSHTTARASQRHRGDRWKGSDISVQTEISNKSISHSVCGKSIPTGVSYEKQLALSTSRLRAKLSKTSHLIGREKEVQAIEIAFDYISTNQQTSVVWITGISGAGKSYLANQLNVVHHPYHNRSRQQQERRQRQRRRRQSDTTSQSSGSSKSSVKVPKKGKFFLSVTSKFDLQFVNEPFACIKYALTDLTNQILMLPRKKTSPPPCKDNKGNDIAQDSDGGGSEASSDSEPRGSYYYFDDIQQQLRNGLGEDLLLLLSRFIPNLVDILDCDEAVLYSQKQEETGSYKQAGEDNSMSARTSRNDKDDYMPPVGDSSSNHDGLGISEPYNLVHQHEMGASPSVGYKELSDQIKFAFQRFIQIVTSFCPLVWIADDLQWADQASLDMIRTWILDDRITSFMVIGCYRSNDNEDKAASSSNRGDHQDYESADRHTSAAKKHQGGHGDQGEEGNHDALDGMILAIQQVHEERKIKVTDIYVDNLSLEHVNELLSQSLSERAEKTFSLAKVVYGKTHGNIFFTIQLLLNLVQQRLLRFDVESSKWEWDDESDIQALASASANVIELMKTKLTQSPAIRYSLPIAACLGATFSWSTLKAVTDGFRKNNQAWTSYHASILGTKENVQQDEDTEQAAVQADGVFADDVMGLCVDQGLLEPRGKPGGMYCFIHDKVQEAALASIADDRLTEIQYRIGEILFTTLPKEELDQNCFLVANLMNPRLDLISSTLDEAKRWDLVCLNYSAGSKAGSQSAFLSALAYFGTAIRLLPVNHWKDHHKISLDLYSSATECACAVGDFRKTQFYGSRIMDSEDHHLTPLEKSRVCHVLIDSHLSKTDDAMNSEEPLNLCLKLLEELGSFQLPTGMVMLGLSTARRLLKAQRNAKNVWTEEAINKLPLTTDPEAAALGKTFSRASMSAYESKPVLIPLLNVTHVDMVFERGVNPHSPAAFANLASIVGAVVGDFKSGEKLALHALRLSARLQSINRVAEAEVINTTYTATLHWTKPFRSCLVPLLEAYQIGMRLGDTFNATWAASNYCDFAIHVGVSLPQIEAELLTFAKVAEDCACIVQRDLLRCHRQLALNLQGKSLNTVVLSGYGFDVEETLDRYIQIGQNMMQMNIRRSKLTTMVFFGAFEECAKYILEHGDKILEGLLCVPGVVYTVYYGGLSCYIASRSLLSSSDHRRHRRKLLDTANAYRSKLKAWAKKGNPNCQHMISLLDAEHLISTTNRVITKTKVKEIAQMYQDAISVAEQKGMIQDQALANERLAEFYVHHSQQQSSKQGGCGRGGNARKDNVDEAQVVPASDVIGMAMYRFGEANRLYKQWGADAVAERVERRCCMLSVE